MTEKNKKIKKSTYVQFGFLFLIGILAIVAIIRLIVWNQGTDLLENPDTIGQNFDTESEDFFLYYPPSQYATFNENYVDDGELVIVMIGDESIMDYSDNTGVPQLMRASRKDMTLQAICFPNSRLSARYNPYSTEYADDALSLYWLSVCIAGNNYDFQTSVWDLISIADATAYDSMQKLTAIDFNEVDALIINYSAHDYLDGSGVESIAEEYDISLYADALAASIELLQSAYPNLQIITSSPTYCLVDKDGALTGSDLTNLGNGMLSAYMIAAKNVAVNSGTTYVDNLLGLPINENNYKEYLESDHISLNAAGRKLVADKYISLMAE